MKILSYTQQSPIFSIYNCHTAIQEYYSRSLRAYKVNFIQALILLTIYFEGKAKISPMLLVRTLGVSKSSISQALSILEEEGWLKRKIDDSDARSLYLVLTAEGKKHAGELIAIFHGIERTFEKKLGKTRLKDLCESLAEIDQLLRRSTS